MRIFEYENKETRQILALGPESNGNFSFFHKNKLYFSEDFGDLLEDANFKKYRSGLDAFLKKNGFHPDVVLTDLHPLYKTAALGEKLARKYSARLVRIQHHLAHIFSAVGDKRISNEGCASPEKFSGIALDGTGYGTDGKIWGGEVFGISNQIQNPNLQIKRIGHLENQMMIGGELAIQEPARILISILAKFLPKEKIYSEIKKYYSAQEFEVLHNQLRQNFNCVETSSCGRVLDAVSVLLGFCGNRRNYKHEPIGLLEKNSTEPYADLRPVVRNNILMTAPLLEYLIKNSHQDKKRLAATAQLYIAQGLHRIISASESWTSDFYLAGGIANNKIISGYLISQGAYANKKIPRGDAGLSFGQIVFYLSDH